MGIIDILGNFYIDSEVVLQETGNLPDIYWGTGFNKYETSMTVNSDKTGKYLIGVVDFNNFRIVHLDGKTYMEVINNDNSLFD